MAASCQHVPPSMQSEYTDQSAVGAQNFAFCLSLFKMASCANKTMAMEIFIVKVTRSFSVFYYREFDRMMVRMLSVLRSF